MTVNSTLSFPASQLMCKNVVALSVYNSVLFNIIIILKPLCINLSVYEDAIGPGPYVSSEEGDVTLDVDVTGDVNLLPDLHNLSL